VKLPKRILVDAYASNFHRIKLEVLDSKNIQHSLDSYFLDDNSTNRNLTFSLSNTVNMRQLRIIQDSYFENSRRLHRQYPVL